MVHILRGTSRRPLAILLGLFILLMIFTMTPYSNKAMDKLPSPGWRGETSDMNHQEQQHHQQQQQQQQQQRQADLQQQQQQQQRQADLQQQQREEAERREKERLLSKEKEQQDANRQLIQEPPVVVVDTSDKEKEKEQTKEPLDTNSNEDEEEEDELDEPIDNLPIEFNESLFPPRSQRTLETKVGPKQLQDFLADKQNRDAREAAVAYALRQANIAYRNNTVYSVVIKPKEKIPPSGDIHDYSSLARYFWRNNNTADGLPFVRMDGKPNPDMDSVWDYRLLRKVFRDCYYMGQAYFWTGEERYAEKIVFRIKQWFLDEETRMNPNLKYASLIFGNDLGRAQGVLDMFKVFGMFDALKAIEGSKALGAEPKLIPDLKVWFTEYLEWMDNSKQANQEKNAHNNHGTYFTVQYLSILEFLGRDADAKALAESSKTIRVGPQIRQDGAQPHETIRPISFFYSTFNLQGLILLAVQSDAHGVSLWSHRGPIEKTSIRITTSRFEEIEVGGGTIEDAIRYLADFAVRDVSEWPYKDSGTRNLRDVLKMAKVAALVYGKERWQEAIEALEAKVDETTPGEGEPAASAGAGHEGGEGGAVVVVDEGDPNGFVCELGVLSKGTLWHCYK